jgi:predicted metal-dependent enzyme (double-stranded beta helix superfamily)
VKAKFDVDRFVDEVNRARMEVDSQSAVQQVLARVMSDPRAVILGLGEPTQPGLHTMYRTEDLTILNVVWAPLMVLLPHNHNMWASIGIYTGREDNILWERIGPKARASGAASLSEKDVFSLPDEAVHSVTNPIGRLTGAIHIYGGDFFGVPRSEWNPETLQERPFDLEAARKLFEEANDRFKQERAARREEAETPDS